MEKCDEAIADFSVIIDQNELCVTAYINRGAAYDSISDYKKALNDYQRAIELDTSAYHVFHNRGITYFNLGEYDKAITDLTNSFR